MNELATRLRYRTAMGKLSRSMDFDVCTPPVGIEMRINTMLCSKDVEIDDWCAPFSRTPGIHDYHPAAIVAIIKTADEKLHIYHGELRQYIDSCIAGFDCVNPPQLVIDIACGRASARCHKKMMEQNLIVKPNRRYRTKIYHQQSARLTLQNSTGSWMQHLPIAPQMRVKNGSYRTGRRSPTSG